jgi:galactan 5-O-arabinofuranosyltransferase
VGRHGVHRTAGRAGVAAVPVYHDYQLLDFQPYYSFQTNKEQYANPLALYPERTQELIRWSRSRTSAAFVASLTASKFKAPNVFVFVRDGAGDYPFNIVTTDFPYDNRTNRITFAAGLFKSSQFSSRDVGPFTVIVRVQPGRER